MKKTLKKFAAVGLTLTSVMGLVACGSSSDSKKDDKKEEKATTDWASVEKPGKFSVMVDGTVVKETNGAQEFYDYYKSLTGLDIEWIRPLHSAYYDQVKGKFAANEIPDVVLLGSDAYANFAAGGKLWDMTDAVLESKTYASKNKSEMFDSVVNANIVAGPKGEKALYGFSPFRGNGCCTYIKSSYITAAGYNPDEIAKKQLTFDEYYKLLKDIQAKSENKNYVVSCAGFIAGQKEQNPEAPYTNYLPEFYQDAKFTFYYDETEKKYVDGFAQPAMEKALARLKTAVADKILDSASEAQTTSDARKKFYASDKKSESAVFTYWAGTWAKTLQTSIADKNDKLIALLPIKELGSYTERLATVWCITQKAADEGKAEAIFKYFIDTMLDGGDIQMAWEYGAKGTHWDTKAETVTLKGKEDKPQGTYKEGEFHFLPQPEDTSKIMSKNHIDPYLALVNIENDPGFDVTSDLGKLISDNYKMFNANSKVEVPLYTTDVLTANKGDINIARLTALSAVVKGEKSYADAMADYNKSVGDLVKAVLDSLNETIK